MTPKTLCQSERTRSCHYQCSPVKDSSNKDVFIGDAAQFWRTAKLQEHSTCICQPETGCDSDCMNRFMFYECDDSNCRLTEEQCGNRRFEGLRQRVKKGGKYNVGVEVI